MTRITATVVATVFALASLGFTAPAAEARALPERPISISWTQIESTPYVRFSGTAQDLHNGTVWLQRKVGAGHWKAVTSTTSGPAGGYHLKALVPHTGKVYRFRAKTAKDDTYRRSFSRTIALTWV